MNGILNIYKEAGYTSFDVVARLRRILKQKKIGHTGTLDPAARGVLPVCVGRATKLCSMLTDGTKTYEAVLRLGVATDTLDMEGQVLAACPVECTPEEVDKCILSFLGEGEQVPPMYSALKVGGKRLYEMARTGVTVERKPRRVCFYEIDIIEIKLPRVKFKVKCSKGTYIRSLCDDIGRALGCGGCMESLERLASGRFVAEEAHTLSEVEELVQAGKLEDILITCEEYLKFLPKVAALPQFDNAVRNGGKLSIHAVDMNEAAQPERVRMYDSAGDFIGIYEYVADKHIFRPDIILLTS